MKKSINQLVVTRIISAIEMVQEKEVTDGTIANRRMFAGTNIRKAMASTPPEELAKLEKVDVYDLAAIIGQPEISTLGQEVDRVLRYGVNGYYYSI